MELRDLCMNNTEEFLKKIWKIGSEVFKEKRCVGIIIA